MSNNPNTVLAELLQQHDQLRDIIYRCEKLADDLDAGKIEPVIVLAEVAHLRATFDVHNKFEEQLLRPILRDANAFAELRIDRMVEDHVGEHRAMSEGLGNPVTAELRHTLAQLQLHLATEERYFLSAHSLKKEAV